ncbi:DUF1684 domain-containing protein [Streptomyces sp. NPDC020096]
MSGTTAAAERDWQAWRERRAEAVCAPYGPLALTGTHWLAQAHGGVLDGVPGRWREDGDALLLSASAADGLAVDGRPVDGEVRLGPTAEGLAYGNRRLVVLTREGQWAVRVFDPASAARAAFAGIDAFAYDPQWVLAARLRPYERERTVRVPNADGRERGLGLGGDLVFQVRGTGHTLAVAVDPDGSLWGVIADRTSGRSTFRFRFIRPPAPDADGSVLLDFNRALLPPCAFADHFVCPFPPPGNTLPFAVEAGEKAVIRR